MLVSGSGLALMVRTIPDRAVTPAGPCSGGGGGSSLAAFLAPVEPAASLLFDTGPAVVNRISAGGRLKPFVSAAPLTETVYEASGRNGSSGVRKASIPLSAA